MPLQPDWGDLAFPIKLSSPDALIRKDSKTGQLFSLQGLEDPFSLTINTKPINKLLDRCDKDLRKLK